MPYTRSFGVKLSSRITPRQFATKWGASTLKERSAAQEHFLDLCRMLGVKTPAEEDPHGDWFCFERGATKTGGGKGWADVWRRGCFAWEYKGKHKDLGTAFVQLQRYALALENPPLLVASDMDRIEIHTNFTNSPHEIHVVEIDKIGSPENLRTLSCLFNDPDHLKPGRTKTAITEDAASRFASLAKILRDRGGEPHQVAHFLNRILFCLFAQDAMLLPDNIVRRLLRTGLNNPETTNKMLRSLFATMKKGGTFGTHVIEWFNGSLFDSAEGISLEAKDIRALVSITELDWSSIEPSIFGTLFERGLDPDKRSQIGAHYTDSVSIMRLVQPVVVEPLAAEWDETKPKLASIMRDISLKRSRSARAQARSKAQAIFNAYLHRLGEFRVLDPACGSGNFLYLSLQALKDLEHRATLEAEQIGLEPSFTGMHVGVQCVRGIESNPYAAELARVTVWIGEIQWMLRHGVPPSKNPILKPLETIECRDAVIAAGGAHSEWPIADVIVGNPPFLGNKRMLNELGDEYTNRLRLLFRDRLPGSVDLVAYWFEKAREQISAGSTKSAGLVATQSIRKGANRVALERIVSTTHIFAAWSDEPWVNDGASVRVSLVAFGAGGQPVLNSLPVRAIGPDLSTNSGHSLLDAKPLRENMHIAFQGPVKVGPFEIPGSIARAWLRMPNPNGKANDEVLRPWSNGSNLTGRPSDTWIIDFADMTHEEACLYELPYKHVQDHVKPMREAGRRVSRRRFWWLHGETVPSLRRNLSAVSRYIATPRVAKHRFFVWLHPSVLPDSRLYAICRDDDYSFGVLSSRIHCVWALANASRHGVGNDPTYNARTCFETFPFPDTQLANRDAVADASRKLYALRDSWLNPIEWTERTIEEFSGYPPRISTRPGCESLLKKRTLTSLYNEQPIWLQQLHGALDIAVAAAYGWLDYSPSMPDDAIIARLLQLNRLRAPDLLTPIARKLVAVNPRRETAFSTAPNVSNVEKPSQRTRAKGRSRSA